MPRSVSPPAERPPERYDVAMRMASPLLLAVLCGCAKRVGDGAQRMQSIEVSVDGRGAVWPPAGDGCDALVRCCEALAGLESSLALGCQLAAAKGGTCGEMREVALELFVGRSRAPVPAACAATP